MEASNGSSGGNNGQEEGSGASTTCAVERKGPAIRTQPTRSSARHRNKYFLSLQVFSNDLLREKILEYVILSGGYDEKACCSLRLVGRKWNETIIKILYKIHQPLFHLGVPKKFERFCATFASSNSINGSIPPFYLSIPNRISPELRNLLNHCSEGIITILIWMTQKGNQSDDEVPKWQLTRLRKVHIVTSVRSQYTSNNGEGEGEDDKIDLHLLKSVLRDATSLTNFKITYRDHQPINPGIRDPSILEIVTFPASITRVSLNGNVGTKDLEALAGKSIPNLTSLALNLADIHSLVDGLFYRILDNFRVSLKTFSNEVEPPMFPTHHRALISFPVMEKLKELSIDNLGVNLESGQDSLQKSLPKLGTLRLHNLNEDEIRKWTASSKFISVTTLLFRLAPSNRLDPPNSLTMERMQSVNLAFPNVRKLELCFNGRETSGLEYIFTEMTQLTDLKLVWYDPPLTNSDSWNAILIGIPLETVAGSWKDPDFWEGFDMNEEGALSSIKNLQELTSLTLLRCSKYDELPLIFDVTFKRALLKMPKLKKLGGFVASAKMAKEWRSGGRLLEYTE